MSNPNWKKGMTTPNPKGNIGHPDTKGNKYIHAVRSLTRVQIASVMAQILTHDVNALATLASDRTETVFKVWVARIAMNGIKKGEGKELNFLLDRIVGKVTEVIEVKEDNKSNIPGNFSQLSPQERHEEIKRLMDLREMIGDEFN